MSEDRQIKYTDWKLCDNVYRYCGQCRERSGILEKRNVTGRDGDTHTEYKMECPVCGQKSEVHLSKNLTIFDWEGHNEKPEIKPSRHASKT